MKSWSLIGSCLAVSIAALSSGAGWAETYQVKMLNRNATGMMPFEPDFLKLKPGDKIKFLASTVGHNASSIDAMLPPGAKPFKGKINEEVTVEFTRDGIYGIKCDPHYSLGMVMLVQIGEGKLDKLKIPDAMPEPSKKRLKEIIGRVQAKK